MRVPVDALLGMAAPDRRADGFDDHDFTHVLLLHSGHAPCALGQLGTPVTSSAKKGSSVVPSSSRP